MFPIGLINADGGFAGFGYLKQKGDKQNDALCLDGLLLLPIIILFYY